MHAPYVSNAVYLSCSATQCTAAVLSKQCAVAPFRPALADPAFPAPARVVYAFEEKESHVWGPPDAFFSLCFPGRAFKVRRRRLCHPSLGAVVPSNSLACLYGVTEDVRQRRVLVGVDLRIHVVDEAVDKMPLDSIFRLNRRDGERVLVCFVGVQTNQFCRAADIAVALRRKDVAFMIGGFHVSGMLAMFPTVSLEIQQLVDAGVDRGSRRGGASLGEPASGCV